MKVCNGNELLINLYIDGELPESEARALEAHMRECPACRQYCDEICMVNRAVQDLEPPKDLHASIMAAVAAAQEAENVTPFPSSDAGEARSGHKKRHHWLRTAVAMLAIALVGVFGMTHGVGAVFQRAKSSETEIADTALQGSGDMSENMQKTTLAADDLYAEAADQTPEDQTPMRIQTPMLGWFADSSDNITVVSQNTEMPLGASEEVDGGAFSEQETGGASAYLNTERLQAIADMLAGQVGGYGFYLVAAGRLEDLPDIFADQAGEAEAGCTLVISVRNDPEVRLEIADNMRQYGFVLYDDAEELYFPADAGAEEGLLIVELIEE